MSARLATTDDYAEMAATATEAFGNHLMYEYWGKKDGMSSEEADKLTLKFFECVCWESAYNGNAYVIGDNCQGIALWSGPGSHSSIWVQLRSGMLRFLWSLPSNTRRAFSEVFIPYMATNKQELLGEDSENCWYLCILATSLEGRGKGLARKLFEPILERADKEGRKCYLEASNLKNVDIYTRFGFRRIRDLNLPESDPTITFYAMVRDPQ